MTPKRIQKRHARQTRMDKVKAMAGRIASHIGFHRSRPAQPTSSATFNEDMVKQDLLNKMTNWQRNQFLRAHKGDIAKLSVDAYKHFYAMPHHKQASHV